MVNLQDWFYDEGDDIIKVVYVVKIDEICVFVGFIVQCYFEKVEVDR